jgi:hypothetical protein
LLEFSRIDRRVVSFVFVDSTSHYATLH